ncbi:MAG: hypothetical protein IPL55_19425 [Saprospiraceae bacterium]|nr:hypothetical protein [Saprospiraceae bacterium]
MDKKKPSYKNELDLIGVELAKEKKEKGKIEKELFKLKVEFDILRAEKANRR